MLLTFFDLKKERNYDLVISMADKTAEEIGRLLREVASGKIPTEDIKVPFTEITRENVAQFR